MWSLDQAIVCYFEVLFMCWLAGCSRFLCGHQTKPLTMQVVWSSVFRLHTGCTEVDPFFCTAWLACAVCIHWSSHAFQWHSAMQISWAAFMQNTSQSWQYKLGKTCHLPHLSATLRPCTLDGWTLQLDWIAAQRVSRRLIKPKPAVKPLSCLASNISPTKPSCSCLQSELIGHDNNPFEF